MILSKKYGMQKEIMDKIIPDNAVNKELKCKCYRLARFLAFTFYGKRVKMN